MKRLKLEGLGMRLAARLNQLTSLIMDEITARKCAVGVKLLSSYTLHFMKNKIKDHSIAASSITFDLLVFLGIHDYTDTFNQQIAMLITMSD